MVLQEKYTMTGYMIRDGFIKQKIKSYSHEPGWPTET